MKILCDRIQKLLDTEEQVLVAIDGPCGGGKTTLAAALAERFSCNVFHMDDFFLPPERRTEQRLAQPGGNVDRERFYGQVLCPLKAGGVFSYRPYDCKTDTLKAPENVEPKRLSIIEGSYSMHPQFGDPYDLKVFLSVDPGLQRQRIEQRPAHLRERFFQLWIPLENRYFETFSIRAGCDLILDGGILSLQK